MPKDGRLGLEGAGGGVCILKIVIAKGGIQFSYVIFFFFGGGVKFWYTTLFWTPPRRDVINHQSLRRKYSHAKQAVHTKSIRLWMSEENFHKGLSRITLYRLYYISYALTIVIDMK